MSLQTANHEGKVSGAARGMQNMKQYAQGSAPAPSSGACKWGDLTVSQQDQILLAGVHHSEQMFALAEEFGLYDYTARTLFTRLHQLEQPAEDDHKRQILEHHALRQLAGTNLGERLKRALARRDGHQILGPEPDISEKPREHPVKPREPSHLNRANEWTAPRPVGSIRPIFAELRQARGWNSHFIVGFVVVAVMCLLWGVEFFRLGYWLLAPILGWPRIELVDGPVYRP